MYVCVRFYVTIYLFFMFVAKFYSVASKINLFHRVRFNITVHKIYKRAIERFAEMYAFFIMTLFFIIACASRCARQADLILRASATKNLTCQH